MLFKVTNKTEVIRWLSDNFTVNFHVSLPKAPLHDSVRAFSGVSSRFIIPTLLTSVFHFPGRKLIVKPSLMSWRLLRYNDVKQPLALTDMDRLKGTQEPQKVADGKYWALQMEFTLPTSTYATMALREVLRCDTSSGYQASLNQE